LVGPAIAATNGVGCGGTGLRLITLAGIQNGNTSCRGEARIFVVLKVASAHGRNGWGAFRLDRRERGATDSLFLNLHPGKLSETGILVGLPVFAANWVDVRRTLSREAAVGLFPGFLLWLFGGFFTRTGASHGGTGTGRQAGVVVCFPVLSADQTDVLGADAGLGRPDRLLGWLARASAGKNLAVVAFHDAAVDVGLAVLGADGVEDVGASGEGAAVD